MKTAKFRCMKDDGYPSSLYEKKNTLLHLVFFRFLFICSSSMATINYNESVNIEREKANLLALIK